MVTVRKTVWAGFVWLTAAMNLIAATPRFVCRCPNGQVKPFCLGFASKTTGCCCDGTCCCSSTSGEQSCCCGAQSTSSAGPAAPSCCLQHEDQQTSESPGTTCQAGGTHCTKTVAQPPVFAPAQPKATVSEDVAPGPFALTETGLMSAPSPAVEQGHFSWRLHLLPPPTDLVIALQRFVI